MLALNAQRQLILTKVARAALDNAMRDGNKVTWRSDKDVWGVVEKWAYPKQLGRSMLEDCDGIALYRAKLLLGAGVPQDCLMMTICLDPGKGGHAVLSIATDKGDLVMCSNHRGVVTVTAMQQEGYKFLYRQKPGAALTDPWDVLA